MSRTALRVALLLACAVAAPAPAAGPLAIEAAVEQALRASATVRASRLALTAAEADVLTANTRPNPVLSLSGDNLDWLGTGFSEENGAGPQEYVARVDRLVELGHKRESRACVARAALEAARQAVAQTERTLAADVVNACLDVQEAGLSDRLAARTRDDLERTVAADGEADLDHVRARAMLSRVHVAVAQAGARAAAAKARLDGLIGAPGASADGIAGWPRRDERGDAAALAREALAARPEVLALERERARAEANEALQRAEGLQDLTLGAGYRRQNGVVGKGDMVGVYFTIPLPTNDRNRGNIARARAEVGQADARLDAARRETQAEARAQDAEARGARAFVEALERVTIPRADALLAKLHDEADVSRVDVADASLGRYDAVQAYIDARVQHARALYRLDALAGRVPGAEPAPSGPDLLERLLGADPSGEHAAARGRPGEADGALRTSARRTAIKMARPVRPAAVPRATSAKKLVQPPKTGHPRGKVVAPARRRTAPVTPW